MYTEAYDGLEELETDLKISENNKTLVIGLGDTPDEIKHYENTNIDYAINKDFTNNLTKWKKIKLDFNKVLNQGNLDISINKFQRNILNENIIKLEEEKNNVKKCKEILKLRKQKRKLLNLPKMSNLNNKLKELNENNNIKKFSSIIFDSSVVKFLNNVMFIVYLYYAILQEGGKIYMPMEFMMSQFYDLDTEYLKTINDKLLDYVVYLENINIYYDPEKINLFSITNDKEIQQYRKEQKQKCILHNMKVLNKILQNSKIELKNDSVYPINPRIKIKEYYEITKGKIELKDNILNDLYFTKNLEIVVNKK